MNSQSDLPLKFLHEWRGLNQRRAIRKKTQIVVDLRYDFFMSFMLFTSHESPQQQHSWLSEELA